jgi:hypothetical protein
MRTRRFLGVAAAAATVGGLLLPMEAAHAETGCSFTDNTTTHTHSLNGDCTMTDTWVVEDGWTIDGNGHTITADPGGAWTGAIIKNAPGSGTTPATMTVGHLAIDASGVGNVNVIQFDGAKGRVNQVTITGGQGSGAAGYGVSIANTGLAATFATTDQVKVDGGSSIKGYQQAAVHVTDSMRFTVLRSTIGNPSTGAGSVASGILVENLAHGAVAENHINLSGAEPAGAGVYRAGVKLDHTLRVEVKRNVFSGNDADFGVAADNTAGTSKTTAAVDCNLFRRNAPSGSDPFGVAVGRFSTNTKLVNVTLTNTTFQGSWNRDSGTVNGTTVTAGVPNSVRTSTSNCRPGAPGNVTAKGGDGQSKVTWAAAKAPGAWAPLTGYKVSAKTAGRPAVVRNVGPTATSAMLTGLKNGHTYKVTVAAESNGGSTKGTDTLYPTKLSLSGPKAIRHGTRAHLGGKLSSSDRNAKLSKRKLQLWAKPKGGKWSMIGTIKTKGGGHFDTTVKPRKKTTYKVVYGGHPGLASSHKFTVAVR